MKDKKHSDLKWFSDMVHYVDHQVGRIANKLDEAGIAEDTLLIFIGDNGSPLSVTSFHGKPYKGYKKELLDAGTHVPFVAQWKGVIEPELDESSLSSSIDIATTLLAACGLEPIPDMQGIDVLDESARKGRNAPVGTNRPVG